MTNTSDIDVNKLIELRNNNYKNKLLFFRKIKECENLNREYEYYIYRKCNHEWEREESCGMYDRSMKICKKCKLYCSDYMYNRLN